MKVPGSLSTATVGLFCWVHLNTKAEFVLRSSSDPVPNLADKIAELERRRDSLRQEAYEL
jgi:hypothetical protein